MNSERQGGLGKAVLIVDDDPMVREIVEAYLSRSFPVITASSAEEARQALRHADVFAVVTDHDMGGENGVSLLREIQRNHPGLRRILYTGRQCRTLQKHVRSGLVELLLLKPESPRRIVQFLAAGTRPPASRAAV